MEVGKSKEEEPWIDIAKWIACMLVLLGHFFQSMVKSGLMNESALYEWFQHTIYLFHVPLFFICSGYLYQKNSTVTTLKQWKENVLRKALNLGVPYVVFSLVTYLLKALFQDSVNTENSGGLLHTLLLDPISPYWYLYVLFFLFVLVPTLKGKKAAWIVFGISLLIYPFQHFGWIDEVYFLQGVLHRAVWFLLGMVLSFYSQKFRFTIRYFLVTLLLFPFSFWGFQTETTYSVWILYSLLLGLLGCFFIIEGALWLSNKVSDKMIQFSRKNTLPIFLMHTIFAAGIRSILVKLGITNLGIHVLLGISGSIILPVIAAEMMQRFKWLYFLIRPGCILMKKKTEEGRA